MSRTAPALVMTARQAAGEAAAGWEAPTVLMKMTGLKLPLPAFKDFPGGTAVLTMPTEVWEFQGYQQFAQICWAQSSTIFKFSSTGVARA